MKNRPSLDRQARNFTSCPSISTWCSFGKTGLPHELHGRGSNPRHRRRRNGSLKEMVGDLIVWRRTSLNIIPEVNPEMLDLFDSSLFRQGFAVRSPDMSESRIVPGTQPSANKFEVSSDFGFPVIETFFSSIFSTSRSSTILFLRVLWTFLKLTSASCSRSL